MRIHGPIEEVGLERLAADPSKVFIARIFYDTVTAQYKLYRNSRFEFVPVGNHAIDLDTIPTASQFLVWDTETETYMPTTIDTDSLPVGDKQLVPAMTATTTNHYLKSDGTDPVWVEELALTTDTITEGNKKLVPQPTVGNTDYVLTSNGTACVWTSLPGLPDVSDHITDVTTNPHAVTHALLSDKGSNDHSDIDDHIADVTTNPHAVTHALLSDKGTNDHAAIDSHIANVTTNPHAVTKTNVGLGNVDDVQQLPLSYLDTDVALTGNSDTKVASQKAGKAYTDALRSQLTTTYTDMKEPTGFVDPDNVGLTYDSVARTMTISHSTSIDWYYNGVKNTHATGWVSDPHADEVGNWWLYINSSGVLTWVKNTFPGFDSVLVAEVYYSATSKFGIRECHGLEPWQSWQNSHNNIGSYLKSGGLITAGSYALDTNTVDAVTPAVDIMVMSDEDLPTSIPALVNGSDYTHLHFDSGVAVFTTGQTFPYPNDGTDPQYNENPLSGVALTSISANSKWFNVWGIAVPVTLDATSQEFRWLWMTGQQLHTSLALAEAESFTTSTVGNLSGISTEFLPRIKLTYKRIISNLTANTQLDVDPSYVTGSSRQLIVSGFTPTNHNALTNRSDPDSHPSSAIDYSVGIELPEIATPTNPAASYRKLYPKSDGKIYHLNASGVEKVIGGGLITVFLDMSDTGATFEAGKHYVIDMTGASANFTATLPAIASEAVVRVSWYNNPSYSIVIEVDDTGTETISFGEDTDTDATTDASQVDGWTQLQANATDSTWSVDLPGTPLSGTLAGDLEVTGDFIPSGGIVGATTGVAPTSGYVGELALNVSNSFITATYGDAATVVATGDLTTGTYVITDDIIGYNDTRGSAGISSQAILLQVNGVTISDFTYLTYWRSSASAEDSECFGCTLYGVVTVPAAATHTVNVTLQTIGASGTPTNATSVTRPQGKLRAIRIA